MGRRSGQRAEYAMLEVVDGFFEWLKSLFQKTGLFAAPDLANRIWNCDETGFCTAVASKSVLARRGAKEVHETAGGSGRDFITVLGMCMYMFPVLFTFPLSISLLRKKLVYSFFLFLKVVRVHQGECLPPYIVYRG